LQAQNTKDWWDKQYQSKEWLYGKEPSKFLVDNIELLKKGKTLDLATGEGRNAVYLASKGFEVHGIDFSDTALARAQSLAQDSGVTVEFKNKDIDMWLLPLMTFDTVVIIDYKPSLRFLKDMNRGLVQGGMILVDVFTVAHIRYGKGQKPEMFECFKGNELLHNIKNVHVLLYREYEVEPGIFRVQCIAKKTGLVG
jgi:2-polyprenyl-3-methyl-5-hydroxy-6-metoxy-1,4-benzoquinol methylase